MKYGPEKTAEICKNLEQGVNRTDSCVLADISYETFTVWMQKPEFSEAVKKSETKCKQFHIENIRKASEKTWTASAWWLERKFHDEFGSKDQKYRRPEDEDAAALRLATRTIELMKHLNGTGITS